MLYQFRFDRSETNTIADRLRQDGELCQGWGGGERCDLDLRNEDFVRRTRACYDLDTTRIPSNLTRMRDFQDGDLLVVPHLPEYAQLSICTVQGDFPGCYRYASGSDDLNHRIHVAEVFGLEGNIDVHNARFAEWKAKLQWHRYPIHELPQYENNFRQVQSELETEPQLALEASDLDEFLDQLRRDLVEQIADGVRNKTAPSGGNISFESLAERILISNGYRVVSSHEYDGAGMDVDFRCVRTDAATRPFESGERPLLVQVKKHTGETGSKAIQQLLPALEDEDAQGCVISLAGGFTDEARDLANDNGIVLLNREAVVDLVLLELI